MHAGFHSLKQGQGDMQQISDKVVSTPKGFGARISIGRLARNLLSNCDDSLAAKSLAWDTHRLQILPMELEMYGLGKDIRTFP